MTKPKRLKAKIYEDDLKIDSIDFTDDEDLIEKIKKKFG